MSLSLSLECTSAFSLSFLLLRAADSYDLPSSSAPGSSPTSSALHHGSGVGPEAESAIQPEAEQEASAAGVAQADDIDLICSTAHTLLVQSSSFHTEALGVSMPEREGYSLLSAMPATSRASSSADVSGLENFLHTVTTADEVLSDLLRELSGSSSSSSVAQMLQQESSFFALPNLAEEERPDVTAANPNPSVLASPANGLLQSSPSVQQDTSGVHTSSSAALHSHMLDYDLQSPRLATDVVLDTLLEDLRSAELVRQSSSSVLLSRLNSLAEMRRRSASSSPVAGTSQADTCRLPSSELPMTVDAGFADPNAQSASSHLTEPSSGISRSSSPETLTATSEHPSSSSSASSFHQAQEGWDDDDGREGTTAASQEEGDKEERDERAGMTPQKVMTSRLVLEDLLAPEPGSTDNKVNITHSSLHFQSHAFRTAMHTPAVKLLLLVVFLACLGATLQTHSLGYILIHAVF